MMEPNSNNEIMDEPTLSKWIGIGERTLRKLRKLPEPQRIPYSNVGGQIRYVRTEILRWLANGGTRHPKAGA